MTEKITKPLSASQAIKETFANYGGVFKRIFWLVALLTFLNIVVSLIASFFAPESAVAITIFLLFAIVSLFFTAWIFAHGDHYFMQEAPDYKASLKVARKRFLPLIGLTLLYIVLLGILFLFGYGLYLFGKTIHIETIMLVLIYLIGFFVIYLLVFSVPAVVLDDMSPLKGMIYSAKLVWKHWWHVFIVFFVALIPLLLVNFLGGFLAGFLGVAFKNSPHWIMFFVVFLLQFIVTIVTYPLMLSALLVLYHEMKARFQHTEFQHMVDRSKS